MDLRKVKKLIELVEESAIEELEVANGEESVRIVMRRGVAAPVVATAPAAVTAPPAQSPGSPGSPVAAPMAGTFYRAPHPDADPFVEVGQTVEPGTVLCIIESMKMMHEIRAGQSGVVAAVFADWPSTRATRARESNPPRSGVMLPRK